MEPPEAGDNADYRYHSQIPDVRNHIVRFPAFEHDVPEQAHVVRKRVEEGKPPESSGHVFEREHHSREHDHRKNEQKPGKGRLLLVPAVGGDQGPQGHGSADKGEGCNEQGEQRSPHRNMEREYRHSQDQRHVGHSQEHIGDRLAVNDL